MYIRTQHTLAVGVSVLPLCLEDDETPSLTLTVTKVGNFYQGHTCLTLDMAYNNARLIAKPESNWLSQ